ncbi:MAG: DUF1178 family protein [Gammaproteobacteria bacterium]|nr:DUF1178 family protein [Gammaproteobacteria bacterium]
MIIYDLACEHDHRFEGWFKSEQDYKDQSASNMLTCPVCESSLIRKLPTASYISSRREISNKSTQPIAQSLQEQKLINELSNYIISNTEDEGSRFAEEARKIHYGEVEERGIRGQASANEVKELSEEGIDLLALPQLPQDKQKLN